MNEKANLYAWSFVGAIPWIAMVTLAGCDQSGSLNSPTALQMRGLSAVYLDFAAATGKGPANEQQLLGHIKNVPQFLLAKSGITPSTTSRAFVSERDGEPFVIRYGVGICQQKRSAAIIACEKKGNAGTRYVAFADGHVDCIDEGAAKELMHDSH